MNFITSREIAAIREREEMTRMMEGVKIPIHKRVFKQKSKDVVFIGDRLDRRLHPEYRATRKVTSWLTPEELSMY